MIDDRLPRWFLRMLAVGAAMVVIAAAAERAIQLVEKLSR